LSVAATSPPGSLGRSVLLGDVAAFLMPAMLLSAVLRWLTNKKESQGFLEDIIPCQLGRASDNTSNRILAQLMCVSFPVLVSAKSGERTALFHGQL
jgi:hypothetical protein